MPLQNRVDPFGRIHAVAARGTFTGNRGILHDPKERCLRGRRWTSKAWIICDCAYNDRPPRDVMGYNGRDGKAGWTELFFLDEVTALAAGHRPCFTCRKEAARRFLRAYGEALGVDQPKAPQLDAYLHRERRVSGIGGQSIARDQVSQLPDGAMVEINDVPFAIRSGLAHRWTFDGYDPGVGSFAGNIRLITPVTTLAVLRQGYAPVWPAAMPRADLRLNGT